MQVSGKLPSCRLLFVDGFGGVNGQLAAADVLAEASGVNERLQGVRTFGDVPAADVRVDCFSLEKPMDSEEPEQLMEEKANAVETFSQEPGWEVVSATGKPCTVAPWLTFTMGLVTKQKNRWRLRWQRLSRRPITFEQYKALAREEPM